MKACIHLDFNEEKYPDCELVTIKSFPACEVKHWHRPYATENKNCQFCVDGLGRGRINGIFQCYNEGEMPCYTTATPGSAEVGE